MPADFQCAAEVATILAPLAMRERSRKVSANPATLKAKTLSLSSTGSAAKTVYRWAEGRNEHYTEAAAEFVD
jgi:hypothetical protein